MHRGRQGAEEQDAEVQLRGDHRRQCRFQRQAEQREHHESAGEHQQVQAPVGHAGDDRLARQLGAVEEEQQADADVGHPFEDHGGLAAAGQESGEKDGGDQRQGEVIRKETRSGHGHALQDRGTHGSLLAAWRTCTVAMGWATG